MGIIESMLHSSKSYCFHISSLWILSYNFQLIIIPDLNLLGCPLPRSKFVWNVRAEKVHISLKTQTVIFYLYFSIILNTLPKTQSYTFCGLMSYASEWLIGVDIWKGISHVSWLFKIFKMYFLFMHWIFNCRSLIYCKCYVSNSKHVREVCKFCYIFACWKMCRREECSHSTVKEGSSLHLPSKGPSEAKQTLCFDGANNWKCRLHSCPPKCCKHACSH